MKEDLSSGELERIYREDLRNIKEEKVKNSQGEFFNVFRKIEDEDNIKFKYKDNKEYMKYKSYVENEKKKQEEIILDLENKIGFERFFLNWERRINSEKNGYSHYGSTKETRYRVDRIEDFNRKLEYILENSKEAKEYYYSRKLKEDIEKINSQCLVNLPYVVDAKKRVIESLDLGVPVYIIGHLGSGKTQLATEAAIEFTIKSKIQRELEYEMEAWFKNKSNPSEDEVLEKFRELNKEKRNYYLNVLENGDGEEIEKLNPLFISGSHNLTYEDMFVEKTLTLDHSFSQGSYSDYLNMIIGDFYDWMDEHREKLNEMSEEEELQLKIQIWKSFSDLLVAKNSAFGTEIRKIEKDILIAVKEGRTVIVDELNTIAMQNLIGLNDILQRHVGNTAYITGVGPVFIKPGFGFIGTGNLSTNGVNYEGTNELNPAFKSRFLTIEYNYLPQNTRGELCDQENRKENQLFRIILTRLLDKNGNLELPNPNSTIEELFSFSQLARVTQNVFIGKVEDNDLDNKGLYGVELRESVLSIRNILHVLDNWNKGEEKDLSKALWDGFISSITYPDDQNLILAEALKFGFFKESDGWNIKVKGVGYSTTTYDEIRTREYNYTRPLIETRSYLDIIYLLFLDDDKRIADNNISIEEYQVLNEKLNHLEHSNEILDFLIDNEGK